MITGGQRNDAPGFDLVYEELPKEHENLDDAAMDRGYDSNKIRKKLREDEVNPVIPPKKNRKEQIEYDEEKYKLREKVERFFNKIKQFRRIATRYDKLASVFMGFIHIVSVFIGIR